MIKGSQNLLWIGSFILLLLRSNGCKEHHDFVVWEENKKLQWSDFESDSFPGINISALSAIRLRLEYQVKERLDWFMVQCIFSKKHSVASKDRTDYTLAHEQGHFDIGEIYARQIRESIAQFRKTVNKGNYRKLDSVYNYWGERMKVEQVLYDKETENSLDTIQQKIWDIKIRKKLDQLGPYRAQLYKYK